MSRFAFHSLAIATAVSFPLTALAAYPDQTITMVVPYSAGGGADNAARIIAQGLSERSGQTVVVENKGGASGSIGTAYVARAKADGYTVLYEASAFAINPAVRQLPYDIDKDFVPVSQAITVPNILVVSTQSKFEDIGSLLTQAKEKAGAYTFASYGPGSLAHLAGELLNRSAGIEMVHIPYKGGAPALVDVMSGQVDTYFANAASSLNYVKGGKLRAIAVSSAKRMPELPEVPTIAESGIAGFDVNEWNGVFLPSGTPPDVVAKLESLLQEVVADPAVQQRLRNLGLTPVGSSSADFTAFVKAETERWQEVVKANDIQVN
ncbi:tripartite tricarboxylate transporter substrate binding protein [Achromobacter sp. GG226]|uniref:tripartite tricarboxylate transporter substrate binding protein n=1 Tax=Verticiella alkaliphila TaxID=2779529 RepID=UPI001C0BF4FC|nr:tripartite tricarboxylate transporter substrate binding protein [Verticiella sp. GG226]MBU4611462.1 tripartite tricarboxylate transporter substrate binding protein [Verticiella sp. GG226]